jgi:hypothetical protein
MYYLRGTTVIPLVLLQACTSMVRYSCILMAFAVKTPAYCSLQPPLHVTLCRGKYGKQLSLCIDTPIGPVQRLHYYF